jgi:DNA-3-methyladenine glycosylase
MNKLASSFYERTDVVAIARELIGKVLCTQIEGKYTAGIITETEAYAGITDRASHAFGGRRTQRTEVMYANGGTAYVYFCYGMHSLFNIVTNTQGDPHAVLIRGIKPLEGIDIMLSRSGKPKVDRAFGNGPGKVAKILGISCSHTGISLLDNTIWVEDRKIKIDKSLIQCGPRIGVDYAGEDAKLLYRFYYNA